MARSASTVSTIPENCNGAVDPSAQYENQLHWVGFTVPVGQYEPAGQSSISNGVGQYLPLTHGRGSYTPCDP